MKQQKFTNDNLTTKQKFFKDFFIGATSYLTTLFCCTPLQRYEMLLIQQRNEKFQSHPKTLFRICLDSAEGINNLWRSHPNDQRYILSTGLIFALNEYFKKLIKSNSEFFASSKGGGYLAGSLAGATHLFIVYPFILTTIKLKLPEYKKIQLYENNFISKLIRITQTEGILSLYKGFTPSAVSASIYRGLYFGGYDHSLQYIKSLTSLDNYVTKLTLAVITTLIAQSISYPFEQFNRKLRIMNESYFSRLTSVIGKYRLIKSSLVLFLYGEFFNLYENLMESFILDRNTQ